MSSQVGFNEINDFLTTIESDISIFIKEYLRYLILNSYEQYLSAFNDSVKVIENSVDNTKIYLKKHYDILQNDLDNHGLIGIEFNRKLNIFYHSKKLFLDAILSVINKVKNIPQETLVMLAKKFLDALDVILDSLASVLPPLGAAKEVKKSLEVVM